MMKKLLLAVAGILALYGAFGCPGEIGTPTGTTAGGRDCSGGPVNLTYPVTAYCEIESISVHVVGPGMDPISLTITRDSPSAELVIPSGIDRDVTVTIRFKDFGVQSRTDRICVPDGQPVSVKIDAVEGNHRPRVSSIHPPTGSSVQPGEPVTLRVSASDDDPCDQLSYRWSTTNGTIRGSGRQVTWIPAANPVPAMVGAVQKATVTVVVTDGRGGKVSRSANYNVVSNSDPVIAGISVVPNPLCREVGDCTLGIAEVTATATDPDGDPLTYSWLAAGECNCEGPCPFSEPVAGSGPTVDWTVPCWSGFVSFTVTVQDGKGGSDSLTSGNFTIDTNSCCPF
jgi:hypothetical protein